MAWNKCSQHISPCKNCKNRKVTLEYNCHSKGNCDLFAKWLEEEKVINIRKNQALSGTGTPFNQTRGSLYGYRK